MSPEDSLPTWWTNKLAVASNSMNKIRDYLLVPSVSESVELDEASMTYRIRKAQKPEIDKMIKSAGMMKLQIQSSIGDIIKMQKGGDVEITVSGTAKNLKNFDAVVRGKSSYGDPSLLKKEEVEINEKAGDIPDLKKLIGELQNASKMHLAQSKRVQAHVDMMTSANAKGPEGSGGLNDLKKIVGELENASQAHLRQSKSIDAHVDFMGESLDEAMKYNFMVLDPDGRVLGMSSGERQANDMAKNNLRKVRGRVVKLRKPMASTRGDRMIGMLPADNLGEGTLNEQPEHEITVGDYTTKHFFMCGSAQTTMKKHADKDGAEELTRMQDVFYRMEHDAMLTGGANDEQKRKSQILYDKIITKAKEVGIADEVDKYMKMHLNSMLKNDPKLGFGRTDLKESYQEMIARIMSQRSMR